MNSSCWQFWVDRGGTFTDVVALDPQGQVIIHKLLSENPARYADAVLQGIRDVLGIGASAPIPAHRIDAVKMGTTVATNALLERKGEPSVLVTTAGFRDALRIGYQNRPDIFALQIQLPDMLYTRVLEIDERISAEGEILRPPNPSAVKRQLQAAYDDGIRSLAIVFMHGYRYPDHERMVARVAEEIGYTQISASHDVIALMKFVSRGDTTMVDAYLSPILKRYVASIADELTDTRLMFMQSNGGLTDARTFRGKDSILSGPAGGVVGAVATALEAGFEKIIGFDMGGTSTDVCHFDGEYERALETQVAGVRLRAPMLNIHTVAAGGGSILHFDGSRFQVGPDSAGADPGPASYRRGGPLTVTDCNVMVGKLLPENFPHVLGPNGDLPIDPEAVRKGFAELTGQINAATGGQRTPQQVAQGFIDIAVENMVTAIKRISIQRGYNVTEYTLCCFGGAGAQHACLVADALGINHVFIHRHASVLSAYGMGLADVRVLHDQTLETALSEAQVDDAEGLYTQLIERGFGDLERQGIRKDQCRVLRKAMIRYQGTDTALNIDFGSAASMQREFEAAHRQRFGFTDPSRDLVIESISAELVATQPRPSPDVAAPSAASAKDPGRWTELFTQGEYHRAPIHQRDELHSEQVISGPALIIEPNSTIVVEPEWIANIAAPDELVLHREKNRSQRRDVGTDVDPVMLEIFNKLFMSIAEQMGYTLQNTSYSVNMKERLDFSCAIFDNRGDLICNAPHMPVHLGSMGESVRSVIQARGNDMRAGDVYVHNAPYNGGTHLPDVTVITPVFDKQRRNILFYVASRGHHADIGGITPGSMPPNSRQVGEEGALIDNFLLVRDGKFREAEFLSLLNDNPYPARNPYQNLADIKAQIAANQKGIIELEHLTDTYGLQSVHAYMQHIQDYAEESVRRVIDVLQDGRYSYPLDDGSVITVKISIDPTTRSADIDFSGTSAQVETNFNAPAAVCKAAVLYVFRTLVQDDIPLNEGCLKPLRIKIPTHSLLNPDFPAAVVAGNVETSQCIVDTLYGALAVCAASQGTMNNFTFGDDRYQYYETICGGSGAGRDFPGTDAIHSHMTNSRLTDPEVLEWRFPVLVESFAIRAHSGGRGRFSGGNGVIRRIKFRAPMTVSILSNRRKTAPFGMNGGSPGMPGSNYVVRTDGSRETLAACAQLEVAPGDVVVIETPGGGGYGAGDRHS